MIVLKGLTAFLTALIFIINASGIIAAVPYLAVIPDMIKVGADYISLGRNENSVSEKELAAEIEKANDKTVHPFILADKDDFDKVRNEYAAQNFNNYTKGLSESVLDNADALLDLNIYPPMDYVLDEEDSILPISREVINRMIILGYAWQLTGDTVYADRAWLELEKVCGYNDWCTGHFLATAEMALAVSVGYDWFFDYDDIRYHVIIIMA